jgi:hypothetical protein
MGMCGNQENGTPPFYKGEFLFFDLNFILWIEGGLLMV